MFCFPLYKRGFQSFETVVSSRRNFSFYKGKLWFQAYETLVVLNPAYVIAKVCYTYAGLLFFADFSGDISNV